MAPTGLSTPERSKRLLNRRGWRWAACWGCDACVADLWEVPPKVVRAVLRAHAGMILPGLRPDEEAVDSDGDAGYDDPALRTKGADILSPPPEEPSPCWGPDGPLSDAPVEGGDDAPPAADPDGGERFGR